jgi:CRP-like cAMP-binding protein
MTHDFVMVHTERAKRRETIVEAPVCSRDCRFFAEDGAGMPSGREKFWTVATFARNEAIYTKGSKATYAYRVFEGAVRLSRVYADGRRQIVNFHLPNEYFGFELLDEYSSTAEAVGEVVALRCPRACALYHNASDPEINARRLSMLSKSLHAAERHVAMLGHQNARQRVASFFLSFERQKPFDQPYAFDLPLGRQDIADYLGLTIETTCRALSDLKRRRIIDTPCRRQVVVRDLGCLKAIAEGLAA